MVYRRFLRPRRRRIVRRAVRARCQAVRLDDFRLVGERVLDVSPLGMLLAADREMQIGDDVVVSFQLPDGDEWFDAEARVARVIEGWRPWDPGYCVGLRFTSIDLDARMSLREKLRGLPPPVPARPLRYLPPTI